ncbi:hypothetical protein B0T16DRAFT_407953 [Cercophora newfieldiana]|uniref:Uncharacterized protein n=1 Tax=Cercophora newfieldiana TaxID=92897 RepID=A0AA39Y977_9PEZI|nr:hypothetical protein B0T16DRAFT_407953 [Cercophora newfieldiana]
MLARHTLEKQADRLSTLDYCNMEPVDIVLFEEGDTRAESGYRTKNAPGDVARNVLIDRGESLVLRASLASVTNGDFTPEKDAASLLVFEFNFLSMNSGRRFKKAAITLTFDDASGDLRNRPEVWAIAPQGKIAINKTTTTKDVKQGFNAGVSAGFSGASGELGYVWEASQVQEKVHATTLSGTKRLIGSDFGKDNSALWTIEEDAVTKAGLPSFLRAAVLLRRRDDVPFQFTICVEYDTDLKGVFKRLIGQEKPDPVDPVQLDSETDLDELGIATLGEGKVDRSNMKEMDIAKQADVVLATLLTVPA